MNDPRSRLPPVNDLVAQAGAAGIDSATRGELVAAIRNVIDDARGRGGSAPDEGWTAAIQQRLTETNRLSLRRVINATGVVLHTTLGRAPLAPGVPERRNVAQGKVRNAADRAVHTRTTDQIGRAHV